MSVIYKKTPVFLKLFILGFTRLSIKNATMKYMENNINPSAETDHYHGYLIEKFFHSYYGSPILSLGSD